MSTAINCPECKSPLFRTLMGEQQIDECANCRGLWLDSSELAAVVKTLEPENPEQRIDKSFTSIICPSCHFQIASPTNYGHDSGIQICKCGGCGGVWLRNGQLQQIANFRNSPNRTDSLGKAVLHSHSQSQRWTRIADLVQSKILSGSVAGIWLIATSFFCRDIRDVLTLLASLIFPLACIWFGGPMGNHVGLWDNTFKTPGIAVALGGWILLLAMIFATTVAAFNR